MTNRPVGVDQHLALDARGEWYPSRDTSTINEIPTSKTAPATRSELEPAVGVSVPDQARGIPHDQRRASSYGGGGIPKHGRDSAGFGGSDAVWQHAQQTRYPCRESRSTGYPCRASSPGSWLLAFADGWRPRYLRRLTTVGLGASSSLICTAAFPPASTRSRAHPASVQAMINELLSLIARMASWGGAERGRACSHPRETHRQSARYTSTQMRYQNLLQAMRRAQQQELTIAAALIRRCDIGGYRR